MLISRLPRGVLGTAALAAVLLLTACSAAPAPAPTSVAPTIPAVQPEQPVESPDATPTTDPEPVDVSCATLIGRETTAELDALGWTVREDPFTVLDLTLDTGLSCTWGDFDEPSGTLVLFGWAPISTDEAARAESALLAEGWIRETDTDGILITEDPGTAMTLDDDGYGMSYLFGDGWVTLSDTRQGLVLIERPAR